MNIRKSFCFFICITISFSVVTCQPMPPSLAFSVVLNNLYISNKNIETTQKCEKNNVNQSFIKVFQQMGYEAIENFRQSGDGYLSLPEKISKLTAGTAVFDEIFEMKNQLEVRGLHQLLCNLIREKCFPEKASDGSSSSSNYENLNERQLIATLFKYIHGMDCKFEGNYKFSFSVLLEKSEGKKPYFNAFVYNDLRLENTAGNVTLLASLPLLEYPDPPTSQ